MTEQDALVAEVLGDYVPIGDEVPESFADFVVDRIASRPSPTPVDDPLAEVNRKLDAILTLLQGGTPE